MKGLMIYINHFDTIQESGRRTDRLTEIPYHSKNIKIRTGLQRRQKLQKLEGTLVR